MTDLPRHTLVEARAGAYVLRCAVRDRRRRNRRSPTNSVILEIVGPAGFEKKLPRIAAGREIGDVFGSLVGTDAIRAFELPEGKCVVTEPGRSWLPGTIGYGIFGLTALSGLLWVVAGPVVGEVGRNALLAICLLTPLLIFIPDRCLNDTRRWSYHTDGESMPLDDWDLPEDIGADAAEQVDTVKEEYGRLLSDIAYRVECPALFDAAEPHTEQLTLALFRWDSSAARLEPQELVELATTIRSTFLAAKHHAERVGMNHLPEAARPAAKRALHAVRRARDPQAPAAERQAALRAAVEILDDLALYYLPSPGEARDALGGRRLKQLPGRRP